MIAKAHKKKRRNEATRSGKKMVECGQIHPGKEKRTSKRKRRTNERTREREKEKKQRTLCVQAIAPL